MKWGGSSTALRHYTQSYSYDEVGNMLELQHLAGTGSYTRDFTIDSTSNRLVSSTVSDTFGYDYDARGNLIDMPHLAKMDYDGLSQMTHVIAGTTDAYYQYSGGQRIRKWVDKGSVKELRIYLGSYEIHRKFDSSSSLTLERTTVHVADDAGRIAMLEVRTQGSDPAPDSLARYIYSNHLGSSGLELDESANIISYEEYHPYGTTAYQAMSTYIKAAAKRYRFTGKERDEESGLNYHGARYYIPWLCRWAAVDPLESKYTPWSNYNYVLNNPIKSIDPSGKGVKGYKEMAKNNTDIQDAQARLDDSMTYKRTLSEFKAPSGKYSSVELEYQVVSEAQIHAVLDDHTSKVIAGTTIPLAYVNGHWMPLKNFHGDRSEIKNYKLQILIASDVDPTNRLNIDKFNTTVLALNHELTVHAVKFAEIIKEFHKTHDINATFAKFQEQTPELHHTDTSNENSLVSIVNKEVLDNLLHVPDSKNQRPFGAAGEFFLNISLQDGQHNVRIPNLTAYNKFLIAASTSAGSDEVRADTASLNTRAHVPIDSSMLSGRAHSFTDSVNMVHYFEYKIGTLQYNSPTHFYTR